MEKKSKGCLSKDKGCKCTELGCWAGKFLTWHFAGKTPSKGITWDREREGWDRKYAPQSHIRQQFSIHQGALCKVLLWALTALGRHSTCHPCPYTHLWPHSPFVVQLGYPSHCPEGSTGLLCAWAGSWLGLPWLELLPAIPSAEQTELRHSVTPLLNSSAQFI